MSTAAFPRRSASPSRRCRPPPSSDTAAGPTDELGRQLAAGRSPTICKNSGLFKPPAPAQRAQTVDYGEVTAPITTAGRNARAGAGAGLCPRQRQRHADGRLLSLRRPLAAPSWSRQGFVVSPSDWRRAAHKCADTIYTRLTGEGPYFDSRIVYVSETGPKGNRIKRLAIMDQDGANHRFLTNGQSIVLTPRLLAEPAADRLYELCRTSARRSTSTTSHRRGSGCWSTIASLTFAPRFSPDGRWVLFSMAVAGNTDLYRVADGRRLAAAADQFARASTPAAAIRPTDRSIVFESDRCGTQQLYVMNADGSNQQRISFGGGRYATPSWSPRGDLIAFTRIGGGFRIGVMSPSGGGEKLLTNGWSDEGAELVAQWPRADVLPLGAGRSGRAGSVVGRSDRGQ